MIVIKNWIVNLFKNLDKTDFKIIKIGLKFCFGLLIFATIVLSFYLHINHLFIYKFGLTIFKLSLYFSVEFIICGLVADIVKKQIE